MRSPIKIADRLSLPPQLRPGLPTVELLGKSTVLIAHHRGLTEYTAQRICTASKVGTIAVTGRELNITQMSRDYLTVSGKITGVAYAEADTCFDT